MRPTTSPEDLFVFRDLDLPDVPDAGIFLGVVEEGRGAAAPAEPEEEDRDDCVLSLSVFGGLTLPEESERCRDFEEDDGSLGGRVARSSAEVEVAVEVEVDEEDLLFVLAGLALPDRCSCSARPALVLALAWFCCRLRWSSCCWVTEGRRFLRLKSSANIASINAAEAASASMGI